jgi:hypothetical protein
MMTTIALLQAIVVIAQSSSAASDAYKNELGVDVANILTFLSKKNESYLVNYKRHVSEKHALRSGLNLDWSTDEDGYKVVGVKVGYERGYAAVADGWRLHVGADASYAYRANNFQPNTAIRYGLHPLVGFSYFPLKRLSISTEVNLNLLYTDYRSSGSFSSSANGNVFDVNIGSVGMLIIHYHF